MSALLTCLAMVTLPSLLAFAWVEADAWLVRAEREVQR